VLAQRSLLEALRLKSPKARFLLTSSTATFGAVRDGAPPPGDYTKQVPGNTYGFHKVVCEMMLNEYSRRGWVDGRGLRLPVIVVRPGAPNKAFTTGWSSAVREPLQGQPTTLAVGAASRLPCASYQTAAAAIEHMLVHVQDASLRRLGLDRTFTLPSLSLSPAELYAAAAEIAEARGIPLGEMNEAPNELATRVVQSMGGVADGSRAQELGLPQV
jgi:nucleoside-diphosphate-sugar epimerase